jgi:hypothetical protein
MAIYLDDEGKPSATRTVVFIFVILTAVVVLMDVASPRFEAQDRIYDLLQTVVMVIIGAMATRSTVKYFRPDYETVQDLDADGQTMIGYDVVETDEMGWAEIEEEA